MRPGSPSAVLAAALLLAGCADRTPPAAPPVASNVPLQMLEHDFGVIPHGESRQHEFRLDLSGFDEPYVPLRVHLDCACGHADLFLRHANGNERVVIPNAAATNRPAQDEQLFVRIVIDTTTKEALDLPKTQSKGFVVLQAVDESRGVVRVSWPMLLRFGIESPVDLRPFAALDFGRVATSQRGEMLTTLRGDERHRDLTFGPVTCENANLTVVLEPAADHVVLRAKLRPGELGNHRALVSVATSRPDYRVPLIATWKVVPDLEATPMAKISLRAPLARAQREDEIGTQFLQVTDHDAARSAEFAVQSVVGADGRDLSAHFAVTFAPIASQPRQRRMFVRYTGGLSEMVRGSIVLSKGGSDGPLLPIELVLFPAK